MSGECSSLCRVLSEMIYEADLKNIWVIRSPNQLVS